MAVTLKDGVRFRVTRAPLGYAMEWQRQREDGKLIRLINFVTHEEARLLGLSVFRWAFKTYTAHFRVFGGGTVRDVRP